jgi:hypothetical protein
VVSFGERVMIRSLLHQALQNDPAPPACFALSL